MGKAELIAEMTRHRLVAVIRARSPEEALGTAEAVVEGGMRFVEITFSVPDALGVIEKLARRADLHVCAGTVLSKEEAQGAISAGAQVVVSPTLELDLIPICRKADVVCVSGAATPTEILAAARAGADLVKLFPADCLGGIAFIKQILGPFPDIRLMVSGGVTLDNVKEHVSLGVIGIALSSAYLNNYFLQHGYGRLAEHAREFVKRVNEAQAL